MKITLHAMKYQKQGTWIQRPWVWAEGHGWNHFYPELIDSPIPIISLDEFYQIMAEHDPEIELNMTPKTVLYEYKIPSRVEQIQFLKDHRELLKSLHPKITYLFPQRTLLLVGNYNDQCEYLAQTFEAMGWEVKRCATDLYNAPNVDYRVLDYGMRSFVKEQYRYCTSLYPMGKILNYAHPDHILVVQNDLELDFKYYKTIPLHYYAHEGAWPRLPHNTDITCFFHAYLGAPQQYTHAHRYLMNRRKHTELIPYVWNDIKYPYAATERPVFFGFMGSYGSNPDPHTVETMDYVTVKLRSLRNDVIPHALQRCGLEYQMKGTEAEYVEYMHTVNLALNVSSEFGWTTERQYHAMGMGCVLVQNYYAGLTQLGFKDRVNCLLYRNKYDLEDVIIWAKSHPIDLEAIRKAGMTLAAQNTYVPRVTAMIGAMLKYE